MTRRRPSRGGGGNGKEGATRMIRIRNQQDTAAGGLLLAIGGLGFVLGRRLVFGTPAAMGPGFFPLVLSGLICLCGLILVLRGVRVAGPRIERFHLRPILAVLGAILTLVLLLQPLGLIPAVMLMACVAAFGQPRPRVAETLLIGAGMAAFATLIFVYALRMPMALWWFG